MHFLFHPLEKIPGDKMKNHMLFPLHETLDFTNEGSEFLDDAIRMIEQPLKQDDESIGTGIDKEPGQSSRKGSC